MQSKTVWLEKKFEFDFPVSMYKEFIRNLEQTPEVLESLLNPLSQEKLKQKENDKWSIQENAGHLITVDELFIGRLEDYNNNLEELRPADVTGGRTKKEDYNSRDIKQILADFRQRRLNYIDDLKKLPPEDFGKSAFHPRLKKQMRLCDMLYFQAEHDQYHLEKIRELIHSV